MLNVCVFMSKQTIFIPSAFVVSLFALLAGLHLIVGASALSQRAHFTAQYQLARSYIIAALSTHALLLHTVRMLDTQSSYFKLDFKSF